MKVDYLSIYFKTSTIPSRTKHEAFKSFGSRAQLLQLFMANFHIFFECNEPILYFFVHIRTKWEMNQKSNAEIFGGLF